MRVQGLEKFPKINKRGGMALKRSNTSFADRQLYAIFSREAYL